VLSPTDLRNSFMNFVRRPPLGFIAKSSSIVSESTMIQNIALHKSLTQETSLEFHRILLIVYSLDLI
jgi:hypothetical protein